MSGAAAGAGEPGAGAGDADRGGMRAAAVAAAIALIALLLASVGIAAATAHATLLSGASRGAGLLRGALREAVASTGANLNGRPVLTLVFVLVPVAACALGAWLAAAQTRELGAAERLRWGAATAVPFTAGLVVIALLARGHTAVHVPAPLRGELGNGTLRVPVRIAIDSVIVHGALWGALGGVLGAGFALRREGVRLAAPPQLRTISAALARPLAIVLAALAVSGVAFWEVSTLNGDSGARFSRGEGVALTENAFFAGEYALNFVGLGVLARFPSAPAPLSDAQVAKARTHLLDDRGRVGIHLPDYRHAYPAALLALLVVIVCLVPFLGAAYAGGELARRMRAPTGGAAAAWGAVVGPTWAVALCALRLLSYERAALDPGELFLGVLVGGGVAGALGGLLAHKRAGRAFPGWGRRIQACDLRRDRPHPWRAQ